MNCNENPQTLKFFLNPESMFKGA